VTSTGRVRPAAVTARGWGWRHAGRRRWAVRDLDLQIAPGERVLLLGASGAGKSTLLHALAGVLGGDEEGERAGELLVDGRPPVAGRGTAGLVLQDPDSQVVLARVGDDVAFGCENLGVPRDELWRRVDEALDAVGLAVPRAASTSTLSGGQKQRLALAGALAMRPGLLLLDEPTANLDPDGIREVRDAVGRVLDETGATLLVVEHRVAVWRELVERAVVLDPDGGVLADGPVERVLIEEGERLARAGVWVPEHPPRLPGRRPRSTEAPALIEAVSLAVGRRAPGARRAEVASDGIGATVAAGRVLAVMGPNGAGKSTLALTLAGLLPPVAGELRATSQLAGELPAEPARWRSRQLLTRIGTVFQDPEHQFLAGTVRDELAVGPRALRLPRQDIDERVAELLERLRLDRLATANPFTLSGGEKRRLSVATALATRPRVLVLDEPTFGQDSRTWAELVSLLGRLVDEGAGSVVVTHDEAFVAALADTRLALGAPRAAEVGA